MTNLYLTFLIHLKFAYVNYLLKNSFAFLIKNWVPGQNTSLIGKKKKKKLSELTDYHHKIPIEW